MEDWNILAKEEKDKALKTLDRIENIKPLYRTALEYGLAWSKTKHSWGLKERSSSITLALGWGTIDCLSLDLYLGPEDSIIKDVSGIIEDLKEHPRYIFVYESDYLEMKWKAWNFKYKESGEILKVRAWFENSNKCELVETGELKPVLEFKCEE